MANVEKLEANKVKLTFEISKEELGKGVDFAYKKTKNKFNMPGFRKGKVPKAIIINNYGEGVFYEDAVNHVLPEIYDNIIKEEKLETVSRPEIDVTEISLKDGAKIVAEVYLKPEVVVKDYTGIKYFNFDENVSDEEIEKVIKEDQDKNSRLVTIEDRPIQNGDFVTIDFEGFLGDTAFEGGKGDDYSLEIGSHTFIDTFEEQLVGHNAGDEVDVNVTFPEKYGNADLQGKPALFKVKINEIKYKELPDLDDEFAQDVSEFDTMDEYKNSIKEKLTHDKKHMAEHDKENQIMDAIVENTEVDLPDVMVERQIDDYVNSSARRFAEAGISLQDFLEYQGQTLEEFREPYREDARKQVIVRLALEYIANKENIEVTDEEIATELQAVAEAYKIPVEKLQEVMSDEEKAGLRKDVATRKAMELVTGSALGVDK